MRIPKRRVRCPVMAPQLALNPRMRLNMVTMKLPYLVDLERMKEVNIVFSYMSASVATQYASIWKNIWI